MAKILVVDDDSSLREMLKKVLIEERHSVMEASDGLSAIEQIDAFKPDLVLLDLNMPGMSGEQVAMAIKNDEVKRTIPVIVLTAESSSHTHLQLLDIGVEEFLLKPFSKPHLLARVRSLLRAKTLNDQLLAAFSAIESLESFHAFVVKRLADNPLSPRDFLGIALQQCLADKPEMGSPAYLFIGKDQDKIISGYSYHYEKEGITSKVVALEKNKLLRAFKPYEQAKGVYYGDEIPVEATTLIWNWVKFPISFVGIKEAGLWVFSGGYSRSVSLIDTKYLASIARQYQLYLAHLSQVLETEKAFKYTLESLARAAEAFDSDISQHIQRVNLLSGLIAKEIKCSNEFVKEISISAMMHDVGKILIPKEILNKKGPLSPEEKVIMMRHPEYGAKILGDNPRLKMAREIALYHHEHFDGSGYPNKIKGVDIPLSARIVIIADVYDALRSERPYKRAYSHIESIKIIKEGDKITSPSFFDPKILEAFLDVQKQAEDIFESVKTSTQIFA